MADMMAWTYFETSPDSAYSIAEVIRRPAAGEHRLTDCEPAGSMANLLLLTLGRDLSDLVDAQIGKLGNLFHGKTPVN